MGRVIRGSRKGGGFVYKSRITHRKGAAEFRILDCGKRKGFLRGLIKDIVHDAGRRAPLLKVRFRNSYRYRKVTETIVAAEENFTGQLIFVAQKLD